MRERSYFLREAILGGHPDPDGLILARGLSLMAHEDQKDKAGEPYFVLKASNGQVVGQSESYSSTAAMEGGIESVKKNAPDAETDDQTA